MTHGERTKHHFSSWIFRLRCIHLLLVHPETMSPALLFENCAQKFWAPCSQGTSCRRCRRHQPHKYSLKVRLVEVVYSLLVVNWPEDMNHAEYDMQILANIVFT